MHAIREAAFAPIFEAFAAGLGPAVAEVVMPQIRAGQAAQLDALMAGAAHSSVHVVEEKGEIVGFCATSLDPANRIGEIGLNGVDPAWQCRGIGLWMYQQALAHLRQAGMVVAAVGTGGDAGHAPARRVYARAGFGAGIPALHLYREL